jgi:ABC-type Fe3+-hydroxamate transport system substrate-binding protein
MSKTTILLQDHLQRSVTIPQQPKRIVSLCPSITETLFDLGLQGRIVGTTRFCIHPVEKVAKTTRVGGTKSLDYERLHSLNPDLVIAEKEENTAEMVALLTQRYPVYVMDVVSVPGAIKMINDLGLIFGVEEQAGKLSAQIAQGFQSLRPLPVPRKVLYLIWRKPYKTVGLGTYIHDVLSRCNLENVGGRLAGRYPEVSLDAFGELNPQLILLASEPFPFRDKHCHEVQRLASSADIRLVDGEMFSWYGSRMLTAIAYLQKLLVSIA